MEKKIYRVTAPFPNMKNEFGLNVGDLITVPSDKRSKAVPFIDEDFVQKYPHLFEEVCYDLPVEDKTPNYILSKHINNSLPLDDDVYSDVIDAMVEYSDLMRMTFNKNLINALHDQDARCGELTRRVMYLEDTATRRQDWLREAKKDAGYDNNESFDNVWKEVLSKSQKYDASLKTYKNPEK